MYSFFIYIDMHKPRPPKRKILTPLLHKPNDLGHPSFGKKK